VVTLPYQKFKSFGKDRSLAQNGKFVMHSLKVRPMHEEGSDYCGSKVALQLNVLKTKLFTRQNLFFDVPNIDKNDDNE
jgi:hypothetical protein